MHYCCTLMCNLVVFILSWNIICLDNLHEHLTTLHIKILWQTIGLHSHWYTALSVKAKTLGSRCLSTPSENYLLSNWYVTLFWSGPFWIWRLLQEHYTKAGEDMDGRSVPHTTQHYTHTHTILTCSSTSMFSEVGGTGEPRGNPHGQIYISSI